MGFDWRKVRSLAWLLESSPHDMGVDAPEGIELRSNVAAWEALLRDVAAEDLGFRPHAQWVGHVELDRS